MPRHILLDTVLKMDKDINNLKNSVKQKHLSLRYIESYTEILEDHMRKGQNQALANCANNINKSLKTAVIRWFIHTQNQKILELIDRLNDLEDELVYVKRKCKDYDLENKELVIENKSLLKSSYESTDLINSVKNLNIHKQRLTDEINEKNDTIRRLIQENRELSSKIYN